MKRVRIWNKDKMLSKFLKNFINLFFHSTCQDVSHPRGRKPILWNRQFPAWSLIRSSKFQINGLHQMIWWNPVMLIPKWLGCPYLRDIFLFCLKSSPKGSTGPPLYSLKYNSQYSEKRYSAISISTPISYILNLFSGIPHLPPGLKCKNYRQVGYPWKELSKCSSAALKLPS